MTDAPTTEQLDLHPIPARANAASPGPWGVSPDYADILGPDGDHLASYFKPADGEFSAHAREDVDALLAEVHRLRARLWDYERPATEKERNALRQSFTALAAQAHEDRDYEGAFSLECQLREREEQWKAEDASAWPQPGTEA